MDGRMDNSLGAWRQWLGQWLPWQQNTTSAPQREGMPLTQPPSSFSTLGGDPAAARGMTLNSSPFFGPQVVTRPGANIMSEEEMLQAMREHMRSYQG
jgi:hypothetical protein